MKWQEIIHDSCCFYAFFLLFLLLISSPQDVSQNDHASINVLLCSMKFVFSLDRQFPLINYMQIVKSLFSHVKWWKQFIFLFDKAFKKKEKKRFAAEPESLTQFCIFFIIVIRWQNM